MSILADKVCRRSGAPHDARWSVVGVFIATAGAVWVVQPLLELSHTFPIKAISIFTVGAILIVALAERHLPQESFGPANRVTLGRGAMVALLLALIGESPTTARAWFAVIVAFLAVAMDGVDGWLARRRGDSSEFGARFDMETDALLIFGTAALAWQFGKAGPWILAAGLLRYVFVAASYLVPWMGRTLPKSRRRQTICVLQALALAVCLAPALPPAVSYFVAMAGLLLLCGSFAVDIVCLARAAGGPLADPGGSRLF